uniref:PRELI/MSF1 domain-containing protein n=1 Tax=Strongyloides papillosus TaxID=174720 RepID=A0A0N5C9L9_STREA
MNCTAMEGYWDVQNLCDYCKYTGPVGGISPTRTWKQIGAFATGVFLPNIVKKLSESALGRRIIKEAAKTFPFFSSYITEPTPPTQKLSDPLIPPV